MVNVQNNIPFSTQINNIAYSQVYDNIIFDFNDSEEYVLTGGYVTLFCYAYNFSGTLSIEIYLDGEYLADMVNTSGNIYTYDYYPTQNTSEIHLKLVSTTGYYDISTTKIIYVSPVSATILFQGINSMSNIMYYDRILTDDEINIISNKGIVTKDLISFLPTVEGEGITTYDVIAQEDVTHNGEWETGVATTPTYDFTVKTYVEK